MANIEKEEKIIFFKSTYFLKPQKQNRCAKHAPKGGTLLLMDSLC